MNVRLNKFLSRAGIASRREADRLISQGRVSVNGRVVSELGVRVDETRDRVAVDGRPVQARQQSVYVLLNKPAGYLVTMKDPMGRPTIKNLVNGLPSGVVPAGRLDFDSEGLLLLTNDGELAFRLTHPRYEIPKDYQVSVEGEVSPETVTRLRQGVMIDGFKAVPDAVAVLESGPRRSRLRMKLHEGRKREIRRMVEAVGHRVLKLKRMSMAGLTIKNVPPGGWRLLTSREVSALKKKVGLDGVGRETSAD
ncbi:MAG: rRNA pseudouridine synthase [Candidatus Aminicenantes bacterium]|nr:rRNA pseudouridine synthase [Candidatus Aminicenantes bacterium]